MQTKIKCDIHIFEFSHLGVFVIFCDFVGIQMNLFLEFRVWFILQDFKYIKKSDFWFEFQGIFLVFIDENEIKSVKIQFSMKFLQNFHSEFAKKPGVKFIYF